MSDDFPPEWKLSRLEDSLDALIDYRGKTPTKTTFGIPLVTAKIIKGGRIEDPEEFIAEAEFDEWMRRGMPLPGDVVMTTEAPLGEIAQLDDRKVALAQRVITLRGKSGYLDNTFLRFLMQSSFVQDQLKGRASGTTVMGIRQSELRGVQLVIPPLDEQRAIGRVLGALDDKIELNRRMNRTLEELAAGLFCSWFVDFDPVVAKAAGRPAAHLSPGLAPLFPATFQDSELGEIPKGWKVTPVSDICENIFSGGTPHTQTTDYWNGDLPWLSSGETRDAFIISTEKTITHSGVKNSSTRLARRGSTVIAGAGQGHTRGQTSLLLLESYINQSIVVLAADRRTASDLFLFFDLARRYEEFRQISDAHSSRGSLTTKLLGGVKTVLPSFELVAKFDAVAGPMVAQISANLRESRTLAALRDTLLPKLLSGELRVKSAEKLIAAHI
jgi:type I restriction enzyme S subunit